MYPETGPVTPYELSPDACALALTADAARIAEPKATRARRCVGFVGELENHSFDKSKSTAGGIQSSTEALVDDVSVGRLK